MSMLVPAQMSGHPSTVRSAHKFNCYSYLSCKDESVMSAFLSTLALSSLMLPVKLLLKCDGKLLAEVLVQIILEFEGGLKLAFCDPRRFGRIRLQEDPANNEPISKLGFDPVLEMISLGDFTARLAAQRRAIKTVILDQVQCQYLLRHARIVFECEPMQGRL